MITQAELDGLLLDTATLWVLTDRDERGVPAYAAPVEIPVRWEDKAQVFLADIGIEEVSRAVVYVDRDIAKGSLLLHGASTSSTPLAVAGTYPVRQTSAVTGVRSGTTQRTVYL